MSAINTYGSETDKAALAAKVRDIRLAEVHEQVLDELLNGEERRRKEQEDADYERQMLARGKLAQQQAYQQQSYQNALAQGIAGRSPTNIWIDEYANTGTGTVSPSQGLTINTAGQEAMRIAANGQLSIGGETLDANLIKRMKKVLKL